MKKPIIYLASVVCLASCKKDKDETPDPPDPPVTPTTAQITVYNATLWSSSLPYGAAETGATVKLYRTADDYPATPAYTGTTASTGEVSFDNVTPGDYYVVAEKEYLHEKISNVLYYFKGLGGFTADSLYQAAPTELPTPLFAAAGNFRFKDVNGDGIVNSNDLLTFPAQKITITDKQKTTQKILMGHLDNRLFKRLNAGTEINIALQTAYALLASWHEQQVTLDAVYTDDYDCTSLSSNWCTLNTYQSTAFDPIASKFWTDGFAIIALAGNILANAELATGMSDADKKLVTGQVKALKAYVYMELTKYYGPLPLQNYLVLKPESSRATQAEVNTFITNLLAGAITDLQTATINNNNAYLSIPACKALQARFALQQKNYAQAQQLSGEFLNLAFTLGTGASMFTQTNNTEIIWNAASQLNGSDVKKVFTKGTFIPELRLTEILLINAEASVEMGSPAAAQQRINELHTRASLSPETSTDATVLRGVVKQEWKREMSNEGIRFASLIRWDYAMNTLGPLGFKQYNNLLPVPQAAMTWVPSLNQNAGY